MRNLLLVLSVLAVPAFAQESEFRGKLDQDLATAKGMFQHGCGAEAEIEWNGGKLGHNPRAVEKPGVNDITTLCKQAMEATEDACLNNTAVKAQLAKVKKITITKGKGPLDYKLSGTSLTITIDEANAKSPADQRDALVVKLKKTLDT